MNMIILSPLGQEDKAVSRRRKISIKEGQLPPPSFSNLKHYFSQVVWLREYREAG